MPSLRRVVPKHIVDSTLFSGLAIRFGLSRSGQSPSKSPCFASGCPARDYRPSVQQVYEVVRDHRSHELQIVRCFGRRLAMLQPPSAMLVDLLQGDQRITPGESVAVGSLVFWIGEVELQNGLHGYTDGVFLAFKSKNILPQRSRRAMPFRQKPMPVLLWAAVS